MNADLEAVATGIHEGRSIRDPNWQDPAIIGMPVDYQENCRRDARAALLADPVREQMIAMMRGYVDYFTSARLMGEVEELKMLLRRATAQTEQP